MGMLTTSAFGIDFFTASFFVFRFAVLSRQSVVEPASTCCAAAVMTGETTDDGVLTYSLIRKFSVMC